MAYPKGKPRPIGAGRTKGVPNKTTIEFKAALNALLEHAAPQMLEWLNRVAKESPEKALDTVGKLAEYIHPKLARSEQQHTGPDGGPIQHNHAVTVEDKEILDWFKGN